jgi:hypothetical protein
MIFVYNDTIFRSLWWRYNQVLLYMEKWKLHETKEKGITEQKDYDMYEYKQRHAVEIGAGIAQSVSRLATGWTTESR